MSNYMCIISARDCGKTYEDAFIKGYNKGRIDTLNEIMPILMHIVDTEGCCYDYDEKIDKLEIEWKKLKEQK